MGYDIIGDVHGHADRLEALLRKLGYTHRAGAWRHPSRMAVFVGDLIDRGPGQVRTLELARAMVDADTARVVMGNHELNALGWATPDPLEDGAYLRPRHGAKGAKNRHQHAAYLAEVGEDTAAHRSWTDWFMRIPLWIDDPGFRVVHACWSPAHAEILRPLLTEDGAPTPALIEAGHRRGAPEYDALEVLLKGPEVRLPAGTSFTDKDGHERDAIRLRWWSAEKTTYRDAYIGPDGVNVPNLPIAGYRPFPSPDKPVFIGHYWLDPNAPMRPLTDKVACADYSAGRGGPMVAYRFDGEPELSAAKFVAA